jgi:hypothetical protein
MPKTKAKKSTAKPKVSGAAAPKSRAATQKSQAKSAIMIGLLRRPEGACLDELTKATGWEKHSVRGFLAGALRKHHGLTVTSEKSEKTRVYRVTGEVQQ